MALSIAMAGAVLTGCASARVTLHEEFSSLSPTRIAVPLPDNDTILPLDAVSFETALQRAILGQTTFNVPVLIRSEIKRELQRKGYETPPHTEIDGKYRQPQPAEVAAHAFDAVLYTTIETWHDTTSPIGVKSRWKLEVYHVPTATVLYRSVYVVRAGGRHDNPPEFFRKAVTTSIKRALSKLPRRS